MMDYKNLQVTQTNAACLCNLTDNAASAEIKGIEAEFVFAATDNLRLSLSGSYVDATYKDFIESARSRRPANRLDSSGNRLQRTPETQISAGVDWTTGRGSWGDALNFTRELQLAERHVLGHGQHREEKGRTACSMPASRWRRRMRRGRLRCSART
jgi:outer membrane receptor protein involved in Fe transport